MDAMGGLPDLLPESTPSTGNIAPSDSQFQPLQPPAPEVAEESNADALYTNSNDMMSDPLMSASASALPYALKADYSGAGFFDKFRFQDSNEFYQKMNRSDPTGGYVTYVDRKTAWAENLVSITPANTARIAVDSVNVASGFGRKSVRISSLDQYHTGLFVADVRHMPVGPGTWPALWTVEEHSWPTGGEIDIIENVNGQTTSTTQSTLHTSPGCSMATPDVSNPQMTGQGYTHKSCNYNSGFEGCGVVGPAGSFGTAFNNNGGGTFATEWKASSIRMWFWPRGTSPMEKAAPGTTPQPDATWGMPYAYFALSDTLCPTSHFGQHNLVINTDLCGDWAGALTPDCVNIVKNNPALYDQAYWEINSVKVYQMQ